MPTRAVTKASRLNRLESFLASKAWSATALPSRFRDDPSHEHALRPDVPPWLVIHLPHDSRVIPPEVRNQFLLTDERLEEELDLMTDHHAADIFSALAPADRVIRAEVSRLVVDVERFLDDEQEPMAERGMGVVYTRTAHGTPLRREPSPSERDDLIDQHYRPHHVRLAAVVDACLGLHDRCLILDCHSFPAVPLPYERAGPDARPDICIGTDDFHTPADLRDAFMTGFRNGGFTTAIDTPFSGSLVPMGYWRAEPRVRSIMIEVNRGLYLRGATGEPGPSYGAVRSAVRAACVDALLRCS